MNSVAAVLKVRKGVPRVAPHHSPVAELREAWDKQHYVSHVLAVFESISGHAGYHARVATAQHASHGLMATMSAQHTKGCQLDRSWLGVGVCLDAGVCKVNARSKTMRHDSQAPFPRSSMLKGCEVGADLRAK